MYAQIGVRASHLTTVYLLLTTYCSLLTIHDPLLTTYYSLLTAYCLLLTTYYLLLAPCHFPLTLPPHYSLLTQESELDTAQSLITKPLAQAGAEVLRGVHTRWLFHGPNDVDVLNLIVNNPNQVIAM